MKVSEFKKKKRFIRKLKIHIPQEEGRIFDLIQAEVVVMQLFWRFLPLPKLKNKQNH